MVEGKFEYAAQKLFMKCKIIQFDAEAGSDDSRKCLKPSLDFIIKLTFM